MVGKVLELENVIVKDKLASQIAESWITWDVQRQLKKNDWDEVRKYVFATDTTQTTNSQNPWKNKTTIPKLCQIRDNLYANYTATLYPQRKWLVWEANEKDANSARKRDAIINYMSWVITQPSFKHEMDKVILDYIDYGNCFVTVEWTDQRVNLPDRTQAGYVGPSVRRISPLDIVFNPIAENFESSPKIIRSLITMGELQELFQRLSNDENREEYEEMWKYLKDIREGAAGFEGELLMKDTQFAVDGFTSFRDYLTSGYVEVLTFYGDMYDTEKDTFYKNHVMTVVDRHKLVGNKPNPSFFGYPPIFHAAWRKKQDNLWGMGPLDNLVGMQYRMDHMENMKADIIDLTTFPVQKIKGFVDDYTWQPGEKIFVGEEGDVNLVQPDVQVLQMNPEIAYYEGMMEIMAGAPKEAMGFRTPGEKTKYEVQRLENASGRLYNNKIKQFEEQIGERVLNAQLELARRNLTGATVIKVFNDEFKVASFQSLTVEDITGIGRIKPIAARHFAEQAELIQNITTLTGSPLWQSVAPHFSSVKLAKIVEDVFNLQDYEVVTPYIALAEQADAQKQAQILEEQVAMERSTASGIGSDYDLEQPLPMMGAPEGQPQPEVPV